MCPPPPPARAKVAQTPGRERVKGYQTANSYGLKRPAEIPQIWMHAISMYISLWDSSCLPRRNRENFTSRAPENLAPSSLGVSVLAWKRFPYLALGAMKNPLYLRLFCNTLKKRHDFPIIFNSKSELWNTKIVIRKVQLSTWTLFCLWFSLIQNSKSFVPLSPCQLLVKK